MSKKILLKESAIYGGVDFLSRGLSSVLFPIFTFYLSIENFGVLALITMIGTFGTMLIECGINNSMQLLYFDKIYEHNKRKLVSSGFFLQFFIGVIMLSVVTLFLYLLSDFFLVKFGIHWHWILLSIGLVLPGLLIRYCINILRLHHEPVYYGIVNLNINLLWMGLAILLMKTWIPGITGYLVANGIFLLLTLPIAVWTIRKDFEFVIDKDLAKKILKLGYPFVMANIAYWLFTSLDRWFLAFVSDTKQVGLYSTAFKFAAVITLLNTAFSQAWSPILLKRLNESESEGVAFMEDVFKYFSVFMLIATATVIILNSDLLKLITPQEYWSATHTIVVLCIAAFTGAFANFTNIGISFRRKTKLINIATWIAVVVNLLTTAPLSYYFGSVGCAWALLITNLVLVYIYYRFSRKCFDFKIDPRQLFFPVLLILAAYALYIPLGYLKYSVWIKCIIALLIALIGMKKLQFLKVLLKKS